MITIKNDDGNGNDGDGDGDGDGNGDGNGDVDFDGDGDGGGGVDSDCDDDDNYGDDNDNLAYMFSSLYIVRVNAIKLFTNNCYMCMYKHKLHFVTIACVAPGRQTPQATIQCGSFIMRSIFSQISAKDTPKLAL